MGTYLRNDRWLMDEIDVKESTNHALQGPAFTVAGAFLVFVHPVVSL